MSEPPNSPSNRAAEPARIVVGVDGSPSSKEALRWAARQAALTGAALWAVIAWELPSLALLAPLPDGVDQRFDEEARTTLEALLKELVGDAVVDLEAVVAEGDPASVLIEQSSGADLLVVGASGHGELAGMLLGSVSQHCVTHARCPVVVVRPTKENDPA